MLKEHTAYTTYAAYNIDSSMKLHATLWSTEQTDLERFENIIVLKCDIAWETQRN